MKDERIIFRKMTWTVLLSPESELGLQARDALHSITEAIANRTYKLDPAQTRHFHRYEEALLYSYLAAECKDVTWAKRAADCLNEAIDRASEVSSHPGLFAGLAGLGWTVEHVSRLLAEIAFSVDDAESGSPDQDESTSGEG